MARPKKLNVSQSKKKKEEFLSIIKKNNGVIFNSLKESGISRYYYDMWLNEDKDFKSSMATIQEHAVDFVESKLFNLINDENPTAIIFFLKTRGRSRGYWEKVENDITINAVNFKFGEGGNKMIEE